MPDDTPPPLCSYPEIPDGSPVLPSSQGCPILEATRE